jgi:hypothetical protein
MVRQTRPSAGSGLARPARTPALLRGRGFVTARINPVGMAHGQLGAALKGRGRTRKRLSAALRQLRLLGSAGPPGACVTAPSFPPATHRNQPGYLPTRRPERRPRARVDVRARDAAPASHYRGV